MFKRRNNRTAEEVTLDVCIKAVHKNFWRLGTDVADMILDVLNKKKESDASCWYVTKSEGKHNKYTCSVCKHVSYVPTKCCTECGSSKVDNYGVVRKVQ